MQWCVSTVYICIMHPQLMHSTTYIYIYEYSKCVCIASSLWGCGRWLRNRHTDAPSDAPSDARKRAAKTCVNCFCTHTLEHTILGGRAANRTTIKTIDACIQNRMQPVYRWYTLVVSNWMWLCDTTNTHLLKQINCLQINHKNNPPVDDLVDS